MAPNPDGFLRHLQEFGYHPRSGKHSNCLSECIVHDLIEQCQAIRRKASEGRLVYELNFTLLTGTAEWNVDLVLGEPPPGLALPQPPKQILRTRPSTVQIAIELKTVMTEHRKAVKNRKRDFEAHHDHVHRYSQRAIAGGVMVINTAATFKISSCKPRDLPSRARIPGQTLHRADARCFPTKRSSRGGA